VRKSVSCPLAIALSRSACEQTHTGRAKIAKEGFSWVLFPIDACLGVLGVLGVRKAFHSAFRVPTSAFARAFHSSHAKRGRQAAHATQAQVFRAFPGPPREEKRLSRPLAIAHSRSPRKDSPGFFSLIDACLGVLCVLGVRKAFHSAFRVPHSAFKIVPRLSGPSAAHIRNVADKLHTLHKQSRLARSHAFAQGLPASKHTQAGPRTPRKDSPGFFSLIDACLGVLGVRKAFHSAFRVPFSHFAPAG